ncbi:hypothetical protein [Okeania sp. SIO2B9]|uniref:IS1/IS1595 family N-terminal zinc-binding domain-containing protein n=1 Tax=Okeania sp. SIO2B9 TaxID=2607782 RepID=UPI00142BE5AD|nr:hypothetical protein [Okeania sp. SIO2B9]NES91281.1 hypothetical protein [Okeania sp. SIO2B9]
MISQYKLLVFDINIENIKFFLLKKNQNYCLGDRYILSEIKISEINPKYPEKKYAIIYDSNNKKISIIQMSNHQLICPSCGSNYIAKNGTIHNKKQKYQCQNSL